MAKRVGPGSADPASPKPPKERGVVDLADARVRLGSRSRRSNESLMAELDEIRLLLDQGLSTEAKTRLSAITSTGKLQASILARARGLLSIALEMHGHHREALAAVAMYETPESREKLDDETVS